MEVYEMKKYNMPKMEISLFDAEVVSTEQNLTQQSAQMAAFNEEMANMENGGVAKTISWQELSVIW